MEKYAQCGVPIPNTFTMRKQLKSRIQHLTPLEDKSQLLLILFLSDTPAVDSFLKQAHVFVGRDTLVADAYLMKVGKQFINTLEDNIRRRGAMDKILSYSTKTEISNKVMAILRAYHSSN